MSKIAFNYTEEERQRSYSDGMDFDSWGELKSFAKEALKNFECPYCQGHQCEGQLVYFQVRKVDLYREVEKSGWFGGTKHVDEFVRTVWRIEGLYLKQMDGGWGIFSDESEGYIKCTRKDCSWEVRGGVKPQEESGIRWYSINDLLNGKPFRE